MQASPQHHCFAPIQLLHASITTLRLEQFSSVYLGVEFLGHMETPCITFLRNYETVSQSTCTIPTGMHEDFNFWKLCPFLSGLFIFSLLSYSSLHIMDTNPVSDT